MSAGSGRGRLPLWIEHASPARAGIVYVDWELGNVCNYRCSYCPESLHDGTRPWMSAGAVERTARGIVAHAAASGRRAHFQLTGGEPTLFPSLQDLLVALREAGASASLISNGSRPVSWWDVTVRSLESVTLSHHIEHADFERFVAVAEHVSAAVRTHVNVTMLPERFDECFRRAERLREACPRASLWLKPLRPSFGAALAPYSPAQRELLARASELFPEPVGAPPNGVRGDMRVIYDDGSSAMASPNDLLLGGANRFRGWLCRAGVELLAIDSRGQIFRGRCQQGGRIGNVGVEPLVLPTEPVICEADVCQCYSDLMTSRSKGGAMRATLPSSSPSRS